MVKRSRLEIMRDILKLVSDNHKIKVTPLLRRSGLSSSRFKEYYSDLLGLGFVREVTGSNGRYVELTEKGFRFLERYSSIVRFIEEFGL